MAHISRQSEEILPPRRPAAMQDHRHLASEDVLRFLGAGLTLATLRLVIRELLSDCAVCQETLDQVARSHPGLTEPLATL